MLLDDPRCFLRAMLAPNGFDEIALRICSEEEWMAGQPLTQMERLLENLPGWEKMGMETGTTPSQKTHPLGKNKYCDPPSNPSPA